jgi:hypothetical protein
VSKIVFDKTFIVRFPWELKEVDDMTCTNWLLTICAVAILAVTFWPSLVGEATRWVVIVAAAIVIIVAWTIVECKPCMLAKQQKKKK